MSKGAKNNNYKIYPIDTVQDALHILGHLILEIMRDLEIYESYRRELSDTIEQHVQFDDARECVAASLPVPEPVFRSLNDKILYRQMHMLMQLADEQSSSFSYKSLRRFFHKKMHFLKSDLPVDVQEILNEFLDIRNWSFHNTQSRFTAGYEVADKSVPAHLKSLIKLDEQLNPVVCKIHNYYEVAYLVSLEIHMGTRIDRTKRVLDCMRDDYQEMYAALNPQGTVLFNGEFFDNTHAVFKLYRTDQPKPLLDMSDQITQLSMAIQKKKYDGTDEAFEKWTLKKPGT